MRRPVTSGEELGGGGGDDADDSLGPLGGGGGGSAPLPIYAPRSQTAPVKAQRGFASNWVAQLLGGDGGGEPDEMGLSSHDMIVLRESGLSDEGLEASFIAFSSRPLFVAPPFCPLPRAFFSALALSNTPPPPNKIK